MKITPAGWKILTVVVFLLGFILRIWLLPYGNHHDILVNAEWGQKLYYSGTKDFYYADNWIYGSPTQFPIVNSIYRQSFSYFGKEVMVLTKFNRFLADNNFAPGLFGRWFTSFNWFAWELYEETPFMHGYLLNIKFWPVLADVGLAGLIYLIVKKISGLKKAVILSALYLFMPFTWYESALWGQYDQIAVLLTLSAFLILEIFKTKNKFAEILKYSLSALLFLLAFQIKPTMLFLGPLYAYYFLSKKPGMSGFISAVGVSLTVFIASVSPFLKLVSIAEFQRVILSQIFSPDRNALATHAFNFWQGLYPVGRYSVNTSFLAIGAFVWSIFFYLILTALAILNLRKNNNLAGLMGSLFILGGGTYIFLTGMLDRYYFLGAALSIFVVAFDRHLFWPIVVALILFSLNIFLSWGYPLPITKFFVFWDNSALLIRIFSWLQSGIFIFIAYKYLKHLSRGKTTSG